MRRDGAQDFGYAEAEGRCPSKSLRDFLSPPFSHFNICLKLKNLLKKAPFSAILTENRKSGDS